MLGQVAGESPQNVLAAEMSALQDRIEQVQRGGSEPDVRDSYLLDLQNMHEELRVADEEIRAQQEELDELLERQRSERWQHEQLLAALPAAVIVTDSAGVVRMANAATAQLVGVRAGKMLGKPLPMFVAPADRGPLRTLVSRVKGGQNGVRAVLSLRHADGVALPVEVVAQGSDVSGDRVITWLLLSPPSGDSGDALQARPRLARAFSEIAQVPLHSSGKREVLVRVASICAEALGPGAGVSVALGEPHNPAHVGADRPLAQLLDGAQMMAGEGPTFTAWETRRAVTTTDLRDDPRWPRLTGYIGTAEVGSALAVPVLRQGCSGGVLNVYAGPGQRLGPSQERIAQLMADTVAAILQEMDKRTELETLAGQLQEALQSRAVIDQAKGMIMMRERCDADAAFRKLVALSSKSNVKLRDVARRIVDSTVRN